MLGTRGAIIGESLLSSILTIKFVQPAPAALTGKIMSVIGHGDEREHIGTMAHDIAQKMFIGQAKVVAAYAAVFLVAFGAIGYGTNELLKHNQQQVHPQVQVGDVVRTDRPK